MTSASETRDVRHGILDAAERIMAAKGFSGVGLNEILAEAHVPKGSFYHYFGSKDAFGEALLVRYFEEYLADLDEILAEPGFTGAERLMRYFAGWQDNQGHLCGQGKCLAVKLAAEVADLSEAMRRALKSGTAGIVARLARAIAAGAEDGSLAIETSPQATAETLYATWLGASLMAKIVRTPAPFETAIVATRRLLGLARR